MDAKDVKSAIVPPLKPNPSKSLIAAIGPAPPPPTKQTARSIASASAATSTAAAAAAPAPVTNPSKDHRYICVKQIGSGSYGKVFIADDLLTKQRVAIKVVSVYEQDGIAGYFMREVNSLQTCDHPNIIRILEIAYVHPSDTRKLFADESIDIIANDIPRANHPALVFPQMKQDLYSYLKNRREIDPLLIQKWMFQLLHGIEYMHSKMIMHRDLKPQNLLLTTSNPPETPDLVIADLGLSRCDVIPLKPNNIEVVTIWYRAIELLRSPPPSSSANNGEPLYDNSIDLWSFGCIFGEMFKGRQLFPGNTHVRDQIKQIVNYMGVPSVTDWPELSTKFKEIHTYLTSTKFDTRHQITIYDFPGLNRDGYDLLQRCLTYDPTKRITAREALEHKYFDSIRAQMTARYENDQKKRYDIPNATAAHVPIMNNFTSPTSSQQQQLSTTGAPVEPISVFSTKSSASSSSSSISAMVSPENATISATATSYVASPPATNTPKKNGDRKDNYQTRVHGINSNLVFIPSALIQRSDKSKK